MNIKKIVIIPADPMKSVIELAPRTAVRFVSADGDVYTIKAEPAKYGHGIAITVDRRGIDKLVIEPVAGNRINIK